MNLNAFLGFSWGRGALELWVVKDGAGWYKCLATLQRLSLVMRPLLAL